MRSLQTLGFWGNQFENSDFSKADRDYIKIFKRNMRRKKKTTIVTFESRERMTIRDRGRRMIAWCEQCGADVLMVTPIEAAALARTDAGAIFRGVELGVLHSVERKTGALLVCSQSLLQQK